MAKRLRAHRVHGAKPPTAQRLRRRVRHAGLFLLLSTHILQTLAAPAPTASVNIKLTYAQNVMVRLSGLSDFALGTWTGAGPLEANSNVCVGRTGAADSGNYQILATGDGAPGDPQAFTLSNGSGYLTYTTYFNDKRGVNGRATLTPGTPLPGQSGTANQLTQNLEGCVRTNANVSIEVPEAQLSSVGPGNYTGTLTLTVSPE